MIFLLIILVALIPTTGNCKVELAELEWGIDSPFLDEIKEEQEAQGEQGAQGEGYALQEEFSQKEEL